MKHIVINLIIAGMAFVGLPSKAMALEKTFPAMSRPSETLTIYSSTDVERVVPLITAFQKRSPATAIQYLELETIELFERVTEEMDAGKSTADLTLSSAMDLQIKLVNDGYTQSFQSHETDGLPAWANWRNEAFGFTYEPAVIVYNQKLAPELAAVTTRFKLANMLNQNSARLSGRVVTYDPKRSGVGYLFSTQDAVQSEDFWYLARSLGDNEVRQMSGSADMIDRVASGDALLAYNVLGSYALARLRNNSDLAVTIPRDYCLIMSRIAVIPKTAANPEAAGRFIDFLRSREGQQLIAGPASLYALRTDIQGHATARKLQEDRQGPLLPIRLGPGLLVYLDRLKRQDFLERWKRTISNK